MKKNKREILNEALFLIDLARALAKKQFPKHSEAKIMEQVQYLLAEQLVYHAQAARDLK